jgi:hypothetical protein
LIVGATLTFFSSVNAAPLAKPAFCNPPPHPSDLSVSDVTFGKIEATDCYGVVQSSSNSSSTIGFDDFDLLLNAVPNGSTATNTVDGISFTLGVQYTQIDPANPALVDKTSGSWDLSWTGGDAPLTLDILVVLQSPGTFVSYLFDDLTITATPGSGSGAWVISYLFNEDIPILSSFAIYAREVTGSDTTPTPVDEPGTVALLALACLGLALAQRRSARA